KFIIFCIIFILIIRIPFYLHKHGLIFSSDNALEALQAQAIKDTKTAPFFLFEIMGHNGTLKYLLVAFVWDILGKNYLYFLLVQLLLFILFTCLLYRILKPIIDEKILTIFIFSHFMFIEIVFNYSLFIRAGPYLEMLVFFLIGVFLFDFTFENKIKIFLSYYFFLFSIYIHPVGLFFALGFAAVAIIYSIYSKKFLRNLTLMLGGSFAGAFHQLYYLFFKPKPPPTGEWYKIKILTPSSFSFNKIPQYLTDLFVDIKIIFKNIFSLDYSSIINFIDSPGILTSINKALIYFSLLILVCAIFIVILKCVSILRKNLNQNQWVYLFFFILLIIFILKVFLLSPKPFYEPRHNFDLTFIIMLSYLITFSAILKIKRFLSVKSILAFLLLLIFTLPHYYCYLKMTYIKENSYREILSILENNKVKYLAGDFIIAYVIYFLSERKILVSDSIGPVTIPFFYPQMKKRVDKIPRKHKAFIFFSENYPHKKWHKQFTKIMKITILNYLKKRKIKFKIYKLDYFTLIIPFPATCLQ
ncbi:hypothetical protein NLC82_05025, partial [Candidatus Aminicenantes bacterium AC-335-A11]|nr:hypothetical protein [Candidatus Aminicenantes bacterium AC-335-A11]